MEPNISNYGIGSSPFQSSLEENPEWNSVLIGLVAAFSLFQSSLEENPEWNVGMRGMRIGGITFQSSLEENPEWNPRGVICSRVLVVVSILTRGKPRVERAGGSRNPVADEFQSSLEENPEWNSR